MAVKNTSTKPLGSAALRAHDPSILLLRDLLLTMIAILALGAPARRVVRQALTESILLAFIGGAAGLALAFVGTRVILEASFPTRAGLAAVPITASPSLPVLLFVCAVSLLTGIAFGFGPRNQARVPAACSSVRVVSRRRVGPG